jgi:hypothetical protein
MIDDSDKIVAPQHPLFMSRRKHNDVRLQYPPWLNSMDKLPDQLNPFVGDEPED